MEENPYQVSGIFDIKKDLVEILRPTKKQSAKSYPAFKFETEISFEKRSLYTLVGSIAALYLINKIWK